MRTALTNQVHSLTWRQHVNTLPPHPTIISISGPSSPHVCCHSVFHLPSGDAAILMEYMDAGTLETLRRCDGPFSESSLSDVARQVLHELSFLHSMRIVHRDIKPSNLLVDSDFHVNISDFGVSKVMCRSLNPCTSYVGTYAYMSPERFDPEAYGRNYDGYAAEVWSLGLTLLELYVGYFPLLGSGQQIDWATFICAICFGEPLRIPEEASEEFRSFVECCLQKDVLDIVFSLKEGEEEDCVLHARN